MFITPLFFRINSIVLIYRLFYLFYMFYFVAAVVFVLVESIMDLLFKRGSPSHFVFLFYNFLCEGANAQGT